MCFQDPSYFCGIWALYVSWFICYKKQSLPPTPSQIIQIWWMETYTEFGDSYLIQTFVNKINTKLWNYCQVIPPPSNLEFQIFRKNISHLTSEQMVLHPPVLQASACHCLWLNIYVYIYTSLYICIYVYI